MPSGASGGTATSETRGGFAVEFAELGHCVEFLELALQNQAMLGAQRADFDHIEILQDPTRYTIWIRNLPRDRLDILCQLARASGIQRERHAPRAEPCTINELLRRVKLVRWREPPLEAALAVLLFHARPQDYQDWYTQLLDMGCRGTRVGFVHPTDDNRRLTHIILVDRPPKGFSPPGDWARGGSFHAQALTFYRTRATQDGHVYVEWDHEYPVPQVERLYDFAAIGARFVFVCADVPDHERPLPELAPVKPQWLCVREDQLREVFVIPDLALSLDACEGAQAVDLEPLPVEQRRTGQLELRVQRDSGHAAASVESVEAEIAWHQQAIEELHRDYRSAHALRREPIYLAYIYEQALGTDGKPSSLNANFRRLLDQPYSYLRHLRYGFYDDPHAPGQGLHVVFDECPGTYDRVWTSLASEVFIKRQEWHDWGLPLYLHDGDDLRPRLEDEALVPLFRKLIWDQEEERQPLNVPVLVRTRPRGRADDPPRWEVLYAKDATPLTDPKCFRFLNERFSAKLLEARLAVPDDLKKQLNEGVRPELNQHVTGLQEEIVAATAAQVEEAETRWTQVEPRIDEVAAEIKAHESAVALIETTVRSFPGSWAEFVDHVLTSNHDLVERKVTAVNDYRAAQHDLKEQLDACEKGLTDVQAEFRKDLEGLGERKKTLEVQLRQARVLQAELQSSLPNVHAQQEETNKEIARIRDLLQRALDDENAKLEQAKSQLAQLNAEIARLRQTCSDKQRALDDLKRRHEERETELTKVKRLEEEIARDDEILAKEEKQLKDEGQKALANAQELGLRRRKLEQARTQLRDLKAVQTGESQKLEHESQQLEAQKKLVESGRHQRGNWLPWRWRRR